MRVGNYWDESQVAIVDIQTSSYQNGNWGFSAPAFAATVMSKTGTIAGVIFAEAVPGSEHRGLYVNPLTLIKVPGNVVNVNVLEGIDIYNLKPSRTDVWPLEWFGLQKLPQWVHPSIAAFNHAMGVVGP